MPRCVSSTQSLSRGIHFATLVSAIILQGPAPVLMTSKRRRGATKKEKWIGASGFVTIVLCGALAWAFRGNLLTLRDDFASFGAPGVALFIAAFALWSLTTLPAIPLMAFGGLIYGPWLGTLCSVVGTILGASATFALGRSVADERIERWRGEYSRLRKVLDMAERHPFTVVLIVRSVAVFPLTLMNYGFGATGVRFRHFIAYSTLTTIPGAALYSGLGHVLYRGLAGQGVGMGIVVWLAGFTALVVTGAVAARRGGKHA